MSYKSRKRELEDEIKSIKELIQGYKEDRDNAICYRDIIVANKGIIWYESMRDRKYAELRELKDNA